jgi:hypothetical protein
MARSLREIGRLSAEKNAGKAHDAVAALVMKDGMHIEMRGGWHGLMLDLETPLNFAAAIDQWDEQPFLRAHWRASAAYGAKTLEQFEHAMEVVGLLGKDIAALSDEEFAEPEDEEFLDEDEELDADHFRTALGEEAAVLVDLLGEAPPIVGFEEETLERGRIPRLAYVRSVTDREGLQETWNLWRDAGVRLLGLFSEAVETPIPFPDTMSADSNDLRTHFFPMPFATDDFLPSLSVSDELFIVGTSKALASKIDKSMRQVEAEQPAGSGVLVEVEMGAFWDFMDAWVDVFEQNRLATGQAARDALEEPAEEGDAAEDTEEDLDELLDPERAGQDPDPEFAPDRRWEVLGDLPFLDLDGLGEPEDLMRALIGKSRHWRGMSYRRWVDGEVPRSSTSIHWGEAPKEGE